jgi:DnaJ-class molecular chaperone
LVQQGFQSQPAGVDVESDLNISLEEAFNGSERQISVDGKKLKIKIAIPALKTDKSCD